MPTCHQGCLETYFLKGETTYHFQLSAFYTLKVKLFVMAVRGSPKPGAVAQSAVYDAVNVLEPPTATNTELPSPPGSRGNRRRHSDVRPACAGDTTLRRVARLGLRVHFKGGLLCPPQLSVLVLGAFQSCRNTRPSLPVATTFLSAVAGPGVYWCDKQGTGRWVELKRQMLVCLTLGRSTELSTFANWDQGKGWGVLSPRGGQLALFILSEPWRKEGLLLQNVHSFWKVL